jgi:hypothetical protein
VNVGVGAMHIHPRFLCFNYASGRERIQK